MKDFNVNGQLARNFVVDDVIPPPPASDAAYTPQTVSSDATVAMVIISANLAVAFGLILGLWWEGRQIVASLIIGVLYYGFTTPFYIAIITGLLSVIFTVWQHEVTERHRINAYERVAANVIAWRQSVEANRAVELQAQGVPVDMLRRLSVLESRDMASPPHLPVTSNYVPAVADEARQEAIRWLSDLYNDLGLPNPRKVQMVGEADSVGRLRVKMLGSKRGGGSREAGLWLLSAGAVERVAGGYRLNLSLLPRRESVRYLPR